MLPNLDMLILAHAGISPPALVRALVENESGGNPDETNLKSSATGLLQVMRGTLKDFNLATGNTWTMDDMKDPDKNLAVGIDHFDRIAKSLNKYHPSSIPLDFESSRVVPIFILGWVNGYSEAGGVGSILKRMEAAGIEPNRITVDTIAEATAATKRTDRFAVEMGKKVAWAKKVARDYEKALDKQGKTRDIPMVRLEEPIVVTPGEGYASDDSASFHRREHAYSRTAKAPTGLLLLGALVPFGIFLATKRKRGRA